MFSSLPGGELDHCFLTCFRTTLDCPIRHFYPTECYKKGELLEDRRVAFALYADVFYRVMNNFSCDLRLEMSIISKPSKIFRDANVQ